MSHALATRAVVTVRLRLVATVLTLCLATPAFAALNAVLERGSVAFGEPVRLVLETDRRSGSNIDLAPLATDFDVLSSSRSTQVQIGNGQQTVTTRWIIELLPRRAGTLTVPSLNVDGASSQPLTLAVMDTAAGGNADANLFMEADVAPGRHYVQGQMLYRVRLYMAVSILSGAIGAPEVPGANVERLGDDVNFSAMRNGRRYDVIERRYAIFPQQSGPLNIGSARFSGLVGNGGGGMSTMDRLLNRGRQTTVLAPPLSVDVLPPQAGFSSADWLPARDLQLSEEWPDGQRDVHAGEPVTRVIRLVARGLPGSQLQIPEASPVDGLRLYPDQPQRGDGNDGEWVVGSVEQRVALMPTRSGRVQLPEVRVRWWDVGSDRERIAVLPARSIEVLPAVLATAISRAAPVTAPPAGTLAGGLPSRDVVAWPVVAGLFALLWLATLVAWWRARSRAPVAVASPAPRQTGTWQRARREVLAACARNDAAATRNALLDFARLSSSEPAPGGLEALAERFEDVEFGAELAQLNRALYGAGVQDWNGDRLGTLLPARLTGPHTSATPVLDPLPPLNPPARGRSDSLQA